MGQRGVLLYHTSGDAMSFLEEERQRSGGLVCYSAEKCEDNPTLSFSEIRNTTTFLVSCDAFSDKLVFDKVDRERQVDYFNSEVIRVEISRVFPTLFKRGIYWLRTTDSINRIDKSQDFLSWSSSFLRRLRTRCFRIDTVPGRREWCMNEAHQWLKRHEGVWENTGDFRYRP